MYFVQNSNPAIISQEMFDQAAQLRSSRRNETCNVGARPFAKKLSCGCCGSLFRSKRIDNIWYWVCRKHEESNTLCEMPPVPENEIKAAFLRLHYSLKHNTAVLDFYVKHLILVRNRQMLWSSDAIKLNKEISDILDQSHTLSLLNRQGMVDPDIFITKNNQLAEQLRKAKQQKEKLHNLEHDQVIKQTQQLQETLLALCQPVGLWCKVLPSVTDHGRGTTAAGNHGGNQFRNGFQRGNLQSDHGSSSGRNRNSPGLYHDTGRDQPGT